MSAPPTTPAPDATPSRADVTRRRRAGSDAGTGLALAFVVGGLALGWTARPDAGRAEATPTAGAGAGAGVSPGEGAMRLAYAPPSSCIAVYRVQIDESFSIPGYGDYYNRSPEHSISYLAYGVDASDATRSRVVLVSDDAGVRSQTKREPTPQSSAHALHASSTLMGPAAPDAACRDRSWDLIEDALALGFPQLPPWPVRVGAEWTGAIVEGDGTTCSAREVCCSLAACLDDEHRRDRTRPCTSPPWTERLNASPYAGGEMVEISSTWSDGRSPGAASEAQRSVRFDVSRGRVREAKVSTQHPFLGVERTIEVLALDDCDGARPVVDDERGRARALAAFSEQSDAPGT